MIKSKKNKSFRLLSLFIKLAIIAGAVWFLYKEIFFNKDIDEILTYFRDVLASGNISYLVLAMALMFFNWGIEAQKWKYLISKIEAVKYFSALKAVFSGVTISSFTPNRIGEYVGRIFYLAKADRLQGVLVTIIGSVSQLLVTIIMGTAGFILFFHYFMETYPVDPYLFFSFLSLISIAVILLTVLYLNAQIITVFFSRFQQFKKLKKYVTVFNLYSTKELSLILGLSFLRYIVFTLQFYLLLLFFNVNLEIFDAIVYISLTFLTMTVIPTVALTEMGVREVVAIHFLGMLSANKLGILCATFSLWVINLALPAIIGSFFIFGLKFFRKSSKS